jgi:CubicO group peptidase (beta-lactamase class C family)
MSHLDGRENGMPILSRRVVLGLLCLLAVPAWGDDSKPDGKGKSKDDDFPAAEPAAAGIDAKALERLLKRAEATDSDVVVIVKDGKLVVNWTFDKEEGPIEAMSATKSVVSVAIGRLIDDGKITSVDQPV